MAADVTMSNIQKKSRIDVLNETKNQLWNAIRRFESFKGNDHPNDPTGKATFENKIKALKEDLEKCDKEIATLNK